MEAIVAPYNLFANMGCTMAIQMAYLYLYQGICRPRSKALYWGVMVPFTAAVLLFRPVSPDWLRMALGLLDALVCPFLLTCGRRLKRLLVLWLMYMALVGGEVVVALLWIASTGLPTYDNAAALAHWPVYVTMSLLDALVLIAAVWCIRRLAARVFPSDEAADGIATPGWKMAFAMFPVLQAVMILTAAIIAEVVDGGSMPRMLILALVFAGCVIVDALMFWQLERLQDTQRAEQEGALLELQVEEYLAEVGAVQDRLGALTRFRHDLRNNVAVVGHLCEAGRVDEAGEYLKVLRRAAGEL